MDAKLALLNICAAYMQSGPIRRAIYASSPREWDGSTRGCIWKLLKIPYGITEEDGQSALVIESWLTSVRHMYTMAGVLQFFLKRKKDRNMAPVFSKVTDDLLFAGTPEEICAFVEASKRRFEVSTFIIDGPILLMDEGS